MVLFPSCRPILVLIASYAEIAMMTPKMRFRSEKLLNCNFIKIWHRCLKPLLESLNLLVLASRWHVLTLQFESTDSSITITQNDDGSSHFTFFTASFFFFFRAYLYRQILNSTKWYYIFIIQYFNWYFPQIQAANVIPDECEICTQQ